MNDMMCGNTHEGVAYPILFTFSRIATLKKEVELMRYIDKSVRQRKSERQDLTNILEGLYHQINSGFREVCIEPREESVTEKLVYSPKDKAPAEDSVLQQGSSSNDLQYFQLKYENGATKLENLNF